MGNRLLLAIISFFIILSTFIFNGHLVLAKDNDKPINITLNKDQTFNKDYFASGNNIVLSGTVNGDAYLSGGNIIVDGTVNGDLIAFGGTITIKGTVRDDVRAGGGNITISGSVGRNLTLGAGSINLTNTARISGSMVAGAGNIEVSAPVAKGAKIGAGQITISNSIGGDVDAGAGQILLTQEARINGSLNYWSNSKADIQSGAVITGQTIQHIPPQQPEAKDVADTVTKALITLKVLNLLSYFVIGLILLKLTPLHTQRKIELLNRKPWLSLGIGFLSVVLFPFAFVILLITIIGIPLAFILLTIFLILSYLSVIIVALWIGKIIFRSLGSKDRTVWSLLIGLIIYEILTIIPFLGWIISLLALFFGLGAIILAETSLYKDIKGKKII